MSRIGKSMKTENILVIAGSLGAETLYKKSWIPVGNEHHLALPWRRLSTEELMLLNCDTEEDSWEFLGLPGDQNQSILNEVNPEYSLHGLMLKLKLQYFGHLMWKAQSEKTTMLEKIQGRRRSGWQKMRWLDSITDSMTWIWANSGR